MLGSRSLEFSSTFDHKSVESFEAPHHFITPIENQSLLHFSHLPSISHDTLSQLLEDLYVERTITKQKIYSFFIFTHFRSSKVCACMYLTCSVFEHHFSSAKCSTLR